DPVVKILLPLAAGLSLLFASSLDNAQPDKGAEEPLAKRVKVAIDKGVTYLKTKAQKNNGSFENEAIHHRGQTARAPLGLLIAGVPVNDDAVIKGLDYLRTQVKQPSTYVRALQTLVLVEAGQKQDEQMIRDNVKHFLAIAFKDANDNLIGWG